MRRPRHTSASHGSMRSCSWPALLELLLLFPHNLRGDGSPRFAALSQLLEGHGISTIKYSLIGPLFSAPLWLLGKATSTPQSLVELYNWLVFAVGLLTLYLLLRNVMDRRVLRTFLLLLVGRLDVPPAHLLVLCRNVHGDRCGHWLGAGGLWQATCRLGGWALAALGTANIPASILGLASMTALYALRRRRLRYLAAIRQPQR